MSTTTNLSPAKDRLSAVTNGSYQFLSQAGIRYPPACANSDKYHRHLHSRKDISCSFAKDGQAPPVGELLVHHAWEFLSRRDIITLCQASPLFSAYGHLRADAATLTTPELLAATSRLPFDTPVSTIDGDRARTVACLLVLCDFNIGGLIRSLGRSYTGDFIDYATLDSTLDILETIPRDDHQPPVHYDHARHLYHQGVPKSATYTCDREDTLRRNTYNNHSGMTPHVQDVIAKTAVDIQKSYAIAIPRWCFRFINGVFLAALGYAVRTKDGKVKGRQVCDPSFKMSPSDTGALNTHIDKKDEKACPKVFYQSALQRVWQRTYNLRIAHPNEDICVYKDDLVAAFRRVRYHPDVAAAYSYVLSDFFIIAIGMVFGARDAPFWFCVTSEARAFASEHFHRLGVPSPTSSIIDMVNFSSPPPAGEDLHQAEQDTYNPGTDGSSKGPQSCFMDDTIMTELCSVIRDAALASLLTADIFIGNPTIVEPGVSMEKFEKVFSHINDTLGFLTDSRRLLAIYPPDKRANLITILTAQSWDPTSTYKVQLLARLLGLIRHLGQILPMGIHLSIHLQLCLSGYILQQLRKTRLVGHSPQIRLAHLVRILKTAWSPYRRIHLHAMAISSLRTLTSIITNAPESIWSRPIGLLIPRASHFLGESDACNIALGGWGPILNFQWRLASSVFKVPDWIDTFDGKGKRILHINVQEFIAIIINIFFSMIKFLSMRDKLPTTTNGYIFQHDADNTTALSWMRHASQSRDPYKINLSYLLSYLIFLFNEQVPSRHDPNHLPGKSNVRADALSRPQDFPTYATIFKAFPVLQTIQAYRVPRKLISLINSCLSTTLMKEPPRHEIANLLKIEPSSIALGFDPTWTSQTLL